MGRRPRRPPSPDLRLVHLGKEYIVQGHRIRLYTIGELARMVGIRGDKTLERWEQEEILPPPVFRGPRGMRLYSISQVRLLRSLVRWFGVGRKRWREKNLEAFKERLWAKFEQKGLDDLRKAAGPAITDPEGGKDGK